MNPNPFRPSAPASPPPAAAASQPAPATGVLRLDEQQLSQSRHAVSRLQQETFERIQRLQSDIQAVATRHATTRISGRPAEKAALVRVFQGLKLQLAKAEQFHADLLQQSQLLDNLAATREFAMLRQQLRQGVLAGVGLIELRQMLDTSLAAEMHERNQTTSLLEDWARHDEDAALQTQAEALGAEDELNALSESEYQAQVESLMRPLEAAAERVDRSLAQAGWGIAQPDETAQPQAPWPRSG